MYGFSHQFSSARVIFGEGARKHVHEEVERLGCRRALLLSTLQQRAQADDIAARLGDRVAGQFNNAVMHTPAEVTEEAMSVIGALDVDCLVSIGGGSAIGLGKALALRTDLPQIVVPTTYAGSEMTPILGETAGGRKVTLRSPKVQPEVVIYDVDLTLSLPAALTAASGMNAIAHAVEALYAEDRTPVISLLAQEAVTALARALPVIVEAPFDREARSDALYGAFLAGSCLGSVGMALHHKLCHTLGGAFNLPHAETHAAMLPFSVAYNMPSVPAEMARVARAFGSDDAAQALYDFNGRLGLARSLRELGMAEGDVEHAADLACQNPYWNPRPIERNAMRGLLRSAWSGSSPRSFLPGSAG